MEIPTFDGYNIPVEDFISIINHVGRHVPPIHMQPFIADIVNNLYGSAWDITQNNFYEHFWDLLELLHTHFSRDFRYEQVPQDLWNRLPSYDGYNISLDDFSHEVMQIARCVRPQFYEAFLDVLREKLEGAARCAIEYNDFRNHIELLERLDYLFEDPDTKCYTAGAYQSVDLYEDDNIVADCGPFPYPSSAKSEDTIDVRTACKSSVHKLESDEQAVALRLPIKKQQTFSSHILVAQPKLQICEARTQNMTEMNEGCNELILKIVAEEVAIATTVTRIDYHTITATPRCATECSITVMRSPPVEEGCIQFQQENNSLVWLESNSSPLNSYQTMEPPVFYEASFIALSQISENERLSTASIFHDVQIKRDQSHFGINSEVITYVCPDMLNMKPLETLYCYSRVISEPVMNHCNGIVRTTSVTIEATVGDLVVDLNSPMSQKRARNLLCFIESFFYAVSKKIIKGLQLNNELSNNLNISGDYNYLEPGYARSNFWRKLLIIAVMSPFGMSNRRVNVPFEYVNFKYRKKREIFNPPIYSMVMKVIATLLATSYRVCI